MQNAHFCSFLHICLVVQWVCQPVFLQPGLLHAHDQQIEFLTDSEHMRMEKISTITIHRFQQFFS
jgi:hypothetical protein